MTESDSPNLQPPVVAVVGAGRLGRAVVDALRTSGAAVTGPHGRGFNGGDSNVVLLCVPDRQIPEAAECLRPGPFVGHCSGATGLTALSGVPESRRFSLHPLVSATAAGAEFAGHGAAVAGSAESMPVAISLVESLGMSPFEVADRDRVAYHAGAAIAANFLITVQWAASRLLATAGVPSAAVLPLARQALDNFARSGPAALTGPVVRGDVDTVAAHRAVVAERTPDLSALFDELVRSTEAVALLSQHPLEGTP